MSLIAPTRQRRTKNGRPKLQPRRAAPAASRGSSVGDLRDDRRRRQPVADGDLEVDAGRALVEGSPPRSSRRRPRSGRSRYSALLVARVATSNSPQVATNSRPRSRSRSTSACTASTAAAWSSRSASWVSVRYDAPGPADEHPRRRPGPGRGDQRGGVRGGRASSSRRPCVPLVQARIAATPPTSWRRIGPSGATERPPRSTPRSSSHARNSGAGSSPSSPRTPAASWKLIDW